MKKIDTLVEDIYSTIQGEGNWNAAVTRHFSSRLSMISCQRFLKPQEPRTIFLCRQLEHHVNVNYGTRLT